MHPRPDLQLPSDLDIVAWLAGLAPAWRRAALGLLGGELRDALDRAWDAWAHDGQLAPSGDWSTWVIKAGRGFGKTRAGAEWLTARVAGHARRPDPLRIALVGATLDDARRVMVEGESGLLTVAADWIREWHPGLGRLRFRTGAEAQLFSGHTPHLLRGPQHHYAWCDELAKWEYAAETWTTLQLGLRLGRHPRAVVTTTPRSGSVLEAIIAEPGTVVTGGPTSANPHLPRAWKDRVHRLYAGTRLGRQELDGETLPAAGALWTPELIENCRARPLSPSGGIEVKRPPDVSGPAGGRSDLDPAGERGSRATSHTAPSPSLSPSGERGGETGTRATSHSTPSPSLSPQGERGQPAPANESQDPSSPVHGGGPAEGGGGGPSPPFTRTLIAVDPPTGDGTCGIVACAREGHGAAAIAHVLADHSVTARSPEGWSRAVAAAAQAHATRDIIAERNQGGEMVKSILLAADPRLRIKLVHARHGKSTRAEPVAHLFEANRARLHGRMPELEAQLLGMIAGGGYEGPGQSPDRADAMVWGVSELMKDRGEPRVRVV